MPTHQHHRRQPKDTGYPESKDICSGLAILLAMAACAFLLGRGVSRNDAPLPPVTTTGSPAHLRPDGPAIDKICAASRYLIDRTNHQLGPISLFEVLGLDPNTAPFSAASKHANGPPGRNAQDAILEAWSGSLAALSAPSSSSPRGEETWKDEADVEWARVLDMATDVLVDDVARSVYLRTLLPRMGSAAEVAAGKKRGKQAGDVPKMPSPVDASPRLPSFMSATKASSSRATNTANDPTGIFPALRSPRTTNNTTSSNAASNNTASNVPDLPSGTVITVATAAATQDSQSDAQDVEDEPEKTSKSASTTKVTASQRARQYLRWAKAHPYPATDKDGNITTADDDEDRKTVYALIRQIDPSGDKLQSLASLCEEGAGEKKWPASWDQGKLGYLKGMIKKDLVRWVRQLVPVEEEEDEDEVEVAANASLPATVGTGSAQAEEAVAAEELAKRVDGLSVGAEVGVQGGLVLQLESQPVGAAQATGGEGGALLGPVGVQAPPPLTFASVPSPAARPQANPQQSITRDALFGVGVQTAPQPALTGLLSPAARPQANPQQILQNTFLGVGIQTAPPPATVVPSSAPGPPANSQQSIAHNWFGAGAEVAPALAPAPVNVQPSPAPAPRPVTQQPVQYDPAWWQWYRQRHAARRRAEREEEEEAGFF
ncbi:hypothetical protein K4K53_004230 [Colletotrichum sp. SAR 10_77]|nr:hypothetical protein K4K53_004230 [Colletotrichum sp. SAR 10_77]